MKRIHTGFTLIELLITLVIAAIVLTLGVPSFRSMIQNNRAITQANELVAALNIARSEAIKRGASVSTCSSTDQASCAASTNWATGWIVFVDDDADGTFDAGETILRVWDTLEGGSTLTTGGGGATSLRFLSSGFTSLAAGATETFTLTIPDCTGNNVRTVTVQATGRINTATAACP